ncbi:MAG: S8 family serine peptidase [Phycisphaerales bacterium]|nr:S8 family serine peptidase [Phycisphaerales bacterium]
MRRRTTTCAVSALAVLLCGGAASAQLVTIAPNEPIRGDRLYLKTGAVDTRLALDGAALADFMRTFPGEQRAVFQLDGPMTPARRAALEGAGVVLLQYLPSNAWIVRISGADAAAVSALGFVRWARAMDPAWRIDPTIGLRTFATPDRQALSAQGLTIAGVTMFPDVSPDEAKAVRQAVGVLPGAAVLSRGGDAAAPTLFIKARIADLPGLASLPAVQFVEEAGELVERDANVNWILQSNIAGTPALSNRGLTGSGQVLGVIDSLVDPNHCAFTDSQPIGPTHRKIVAYFATGNPATHGTHVAGIAVGKPLTPGADANLFGIAADAKLSFSPIPSWTAADLVSTLTQNASAGARVHTNSWGDDSNTQYLGLSRGIDAFMWSNEDHLVVFANSNQSLMKSPENAKNCVSVVGASNAPNQDSFCIGGAGPTSDGRRKPDLTSVGCSVGSAQAFTTCGVLFQNGTSMATPGISGSALLARQYFTSGYYPSGTANPSDAFTPSGALLKAVLVNAGTPMATLTGYPSVQQGWGRLLLDNALSFAGETRGLWVADVRNASGLVTGGVAQYTLQVASGQPLEVTLAWSDAPAALQAAFAPVNTLTLSVVDPNGNTYLGNVFSNGVSVTGGVADDRNNVQSVIIASPVSGNWTVRVLGTTVNVGTQGFGLVATGGVAGMARPMSVSLVAPPTTVSEQTAFAVQAAINAPGESIVPGSATVFYRSGVGAFSSVPLSPVGGNLWRAIVPRPACGLPVQFYAQAQGTASGVVTAPPGGAAAPFSAVVGGTGTTVLLSESFAAGLPAGWTADGLWNFGSPCPVGTPCSGRWAYFGVPGQCTYQQGANRVLGTLSAPGISLPAINPGERLTLSYCSSMQNENAQVYDRGYVFANGSSLIDQPGNTGPAWETRTVDLSPFAAQTISLGFFFDTLDGFNNAFRGWQITNVQVVRTTLSCLPTPCAADVDRNGSVGANDLSRLLVAYGSSLGGPGWDAAADVDGNGAVGANDLTLLLTSWGPCP